MNSFILGLNNSVWKRYAIQTNLFDYIFQYKLKLSLSEMNQINFDNKKNILILIQH